jgi:hypothetical protein
MAVTLLSGLAGSISVSCTTGVVALAPAPAEADPALTTDPQTRMRSPALTAAGRRAILRIHEVTSK